MTLQKQMTVKVERDIRVTDLPEKNLGGKARFYCGNQDLLQLDNLVANLDKTFKASKSRY